MIKYPRKKKKKRKIQITNVKNQRVVITINPINTKGIIREYYNALWACNFNKLDKMDKSLARQDASSITELTGCSLGEE